MKITQKLKSVVSTLIDKVWHSPKGKLSAKLKDACDGIPEKKRLKVVTAMLAVFILVAFFVFGNACYKMGTRQQHQIEVQHIQSIELPSSKLDSVAQAQQDEILKMKYQKYYDAYEVDR